MMRLASVAFAAMTLVAGSLVAAAAVASRPGIAISNIVDVSGDQTAQNETPLAVNPANPANMITGTNDWNYNDGCGVNVTFDGGKTWTQTVPNGFLPGITKFTNDPAIAGDGVYDAVCD